MSSNPLLQLPATIPSLDSTLGAWLLGTFFGILLQGTVYHQTYRYFRLYPKDPTYLKIWVTVVVVIETLNTALTMHASYVYLIRNYFNPLSLLGSPVWSLSSLPIPGSLAAVVSQSFFARRIYLINRRYTVVAIAAMLCFFAFSGFYIAFSVKLLQSRNLFEGLKGSWLASTGSCLAMTGDFLVTSVLIYALRTSRNGIKRTNTILDLLIAYAISTGLIICVFNVLNIAFSLAFPDNLIYTAFSIVLTKLYANTLLVALNTRSSLVQRGIMGENETSPFTTTLRRQRPRTSDLVVTHLPHSSGVGKARPPPCAALTLRTCRGLPSVAPVKSQTLESTRAAPPTYPMFELKIAPTPTGSVSQIVDSENTHRMDLEKA
ncbi:hypothetical protein GY45DRAFT_1373256 [Cubamyces sp. BRFM 1775]|nr:hypothetical protein GY45DRAFT_1373256 [Cubamyces sp. BRFM 1775]